MIPVALTPEADSAGLCCTPCLPALAACPESLPGCRTGTELSSAAWALQHCRLVAQEEREQLGLSKPEANT